jgi:hypothetical protein
MIGGPGAAAATSGIIGLASGQKFGEALKNAAISGGTAYLGGQANAFTQGALQGLDPTVVRALGGAAQGFTQSGVSGLANGNFDFSDALKSALASGTTAGIQDFLSPRLPAGQAGPNVQGAINTGSATLDRALTGAASGAAGRVVSGQGIEDALINSLTRAGGQAVGSQVASMIPETGTTWLDNFLQKAGGTMASTAFTGLVNELTGGAGGAGGASAPAQQANPSVMQTASTGQDNMAKFMELANSLQAQQQSTQTPIGSGFNVSQAFEPTRYAQNQQSLPDFLQSSQASVA